MYFLIITFGFLLAMRSAKLAPLQNPGEGLARVWREAGDLFLTAGLILTLWMVAVASDSPNFLFLFQNGSLGSPNFNFVEIDRYWDKIRLFAQEYALLGFGVAAYLLSRYQKKTDVFFLAVTVIVFIISLRQIDLLHGLSLVWAVSAGIALFQTFFLGLRYRLLFSGVPVPMKGWPVLCLLAGFISLVLWSLGRLVF